MGCRNLTYYEAGEGIEKSPLKILGAPEEKIPSLIFCNNYTPFGKNNNEKVEYFKNGEIKSVHNYEDEVLSGRSLEYYESGNLKTKLNYKEGLIQDTLKHYYESGQLKNISIWKDGKMNGIAIRYFKNGNTKSKEFFSNGVNTGITKRYYENGNLKKIEHYSKGEIIYFKSFYKDGSIEFENIIPETEILEDTISRSESLIIDIKIPFDLKDPKYVEIGVLDMKKDEFVPDTTVYLNDNQIRVKYKLNESTSGNSSIWVRYNHEQKADSIPLGGLTIKKDFYINP
jgi:antitoxin component YwqK of YwqJK toxin-antitoxin module